MFCKYPGCENKPQTRGVCQKHYRFLKEVSQLPPIEHRSRKLDWQPSVAAAGFRQNMNAAQAKVRQALLILAYPDRTFPYTIEEVLNDALKELE